MTLRWLGAVALCVGCSPAIYEVGGVREAAPEEVVNCRFIGTVTGQPGVFGPLSEIGLRDARRAALERAKAIGGNRVVFLPLPEGEPVTELPGEIYSCPEV